MYVSEERHAECDNIYCLLRVCVCFFFHFVYYVCNVNLLLCKLCHTRITPICGKIPVYKPHRHIDKKNEVSVVIRGHLVNSEHFNRCPHITKFAVIVNDNLDSE